MLFAEDLQFKKWFMSWTGHPKLGVCVDVLILSKKAWEGLSGECGIKTLPDSKS